MSLLYFIETQLTKKQQRKECAVGRCSRVSQPPGAAVVFIRVGGASGLFRLLCYARMRLLFGGDSRAVSMEMRERKAVIDDEARTQADTAITAKPPSYNVIQVIIAFKE